MGKPPVAVFIVRHGARLDAANKDWHLTSPTPYDPPLSYGGWLQSRALGARIIKELRSFEDQIDKPIQHNAHDSKLPTHHLRPRKQKPRIVIHTSPYLRCVQTAVAVSSGISQNYADTEVFQSPHTFTPEQSNGVTPASATSTVPESSYSSGSTSSQNGHRCLLRVDACLGEWLSPDYFENITPPPKSEKMVATAKTELLRRENGVVPVADTQQKLSFGHFPGGWGGFSAPKDYEDDRKSEADPTPSSTNTSGQRNRAGSYDSLRLVDTRWGQKMLKINTDLPPIPDTSYLPPVPSYAISPSNPIPDGYVTHARDACVQVDYQWDSMREPQDWGNGGEYGDEWSTMHTRFRTGLERMISWYENQPTSTPTAHRRRYSQLQFLDPQPANDSSNTILIIVTHGAGCNALIGALSGQPALVDVSTASLTIAVRRDCLKETIQTPESVRQRYSENRHSGLERYRLTEVAATDHLRPGTSPTTSIRSASTSSVTSPLIRNRFQARASFSSSPFSITPSFKSGMRLQSWTMPRASSGLWNSVSGNEEAVDDLVPNFGSPLSATASLPGTTPAETSFPSQTADSTWTKQLPHRTLSQRGLWGSAPLNKERAGNSSRRWTVTERPL